LSLEKNIVLEKKHVRKIFGTCVDQTFRKFLIFLQVSGSKTLNKKLASAQSPTLLQPFARHLGGKMDHPGYL